jgi:hypothetical protein
MASNLNEYEVSLLLSKASNNFIFKIFGFVCMGLYSILCEMLRLCSNASIRSTKRSKVILFHMTLSESIFKRE